MDQTFPFTENDLRHLFTGAGDEFILLETARTTSEDHHSYLFTNAEKHLIHHAGDDPTPFLKKCEKYTQKGFYLAGWFSYEFGYSLEKSIEKLDSQDSGTILADLGIYSSCQIFDHTTKFNETSGTTYPEKPCTIQNITLSQDEKQYHSHIQKIKEYILAGDTYQVNYTLKLLFDFLGSKDDLYLKLRRNQQVSFGAYLKQKDRSIMSFSPELFFRKDNNTITVRPMKGTISRGRNRLEDQKNSLFLQTDLKNRAENIMIVDLLRNDLGRIAKKGMVTPTSLFDVETYNSLLQMTSTIQAEVHEGLKLTQLFKSLFPCGSVTGAPKIRTMEIINELETEPRGVYTGAIGFLGPHGQASFNVPIRTIVLDKNKGRMGIGSGIVADSDPASEWQECLLKGQFLTKARKPFELIETLLWQPESGYQFEGEHEDRLRESALYFNFLFSTKEYHTVLDRVTLELNETSRVRITVNQEGQFSKQISPCKAPAVFSPNLTADASYKVCISKEVTSSEDVFLYHKTTNRNLYNSTLQKATKAGYIDALFLNERNEITEGCISNIFILKDGVLWTPPVSSGLLPGVLRQHLLKQFPDQVKEQTLYKEDLVDQNTVVCIGNSVRGLIPVEISKDWLT